MSATRWITLLACALVLAPPALAEDTDQTRRWYVGLEGGMGVINRFDPRIPFIDQTDFEVGGAAVLRAGLQWRDHIRFDGVVTWEGARVDRIRGRLDIAAATANAYYDFADPDDFVRPYLGIGLGVAGGWLDSSSPFALGPLRRQKGVGLAYLVSGGGRFRLAEGLTLACAWQFLGTAALIESATGGSINPTMHAFMIGLHHSF